MQEIREFVFAVIIVCASCTAVELIIPNNSSAVKYVRFLLSLIITVVLLSPLRDLPGLAMEYMNEYSQIELENNQNSISAYADILMEETNKNIVDALYVEINDRFGIIPENIHVFCDDTDIENIEITKIVISLNRENRLMMSDIAKYTKELLKCDCEVVVHEEDKS